MFGNKKNKEANISNDSASTGSKSLSLNTLVKGTVIKGDIKAESDIRIDGKIDGTLNCSSKVIIGPTGVVEGEIICANAVIEGRFDGNLVVKETLSLKETAIINGDASYDKLIVQQGAVINAAIKRNNPSGNNGTTNNLKVSKDSVKKQTEKSPPKKGNPNEILKYSGMVFQIFIALAIAVFIGQKLDVYFALEKPLLTAACTILALPLVLYSILKDLL